MKNNLFSALRHKPVVHSINNQKNQIMIKQTQSYIELQQPNQALSFLQKQEPDKNSSQQIELTEQHTVNKKKSLSLGQTFQHQNEMKSNLLILRTDDMVYILLFCMLYVAAFFLAPNQFYHPQN